MGLTGLRGMSGLSGAMGPCCMGGGLPRYYVEFNGASSYIDCGSDASLHDLHAGAFTADGWIRSRLEAEAGPVWVMGTLWDDVGIWGGWGISVSADGLGEQAISVILEYDVTTSIAAVDGGYFRAPNTWYHFAMAFDQGVTDQPFFAIDGIWATYSNQVPAAGLVLSDVGYSFLHGAYQTFGTYAQFIPGDIQWLRISNGIRYPVGVDFAPPAMCAPPAVDGTTIELWAIDEGAGDVTAASVVPANQGAMTDCVWHECVE